MAFLRSIASVFQPREVKVVRERQERSVKVTDVYIAKIETDQSGRSIWINVNGLGSKFTIETAQFWPLGTANYRILNHPVL